MSKNRALGTRLSFMKITRAGKIRLAVFEDKILYKAHSLMKRVFKEIPEQPYNTYYACCIKETGRLQIEPDWSKINNYPNFDANAMVTEKGEMFKMELCHKILGTLKDLSANKWKRGAGSKNGPSFNEGLEYYKHRNWFKYPDQGIDDDTAPTQPDPEEKTRIPQNDPQRLTINIGDELKKAIASGNINKAGLAFLRDTFLHKPEILTLIDGYLSK